MKTIAFTLIAATFGFAQSQSGNQSSTPPTGAKSTDAKTTAPKNTAAKSSSKAQKPAVTRPQKPKTTQQAPVTTIPQGAVEVEPSLYRYTDSSGKTWMYRQTPFGLSKWEDKPAAASQPPAAANEHVAVTDLGDSVRFEKKTPFGATQWVRKKTELTDDEKALMNSQGVAAQAGNKTAEKQ